jgi:SAM-dependent methyltransferase
MIAINRNTTNLIRNLMDYCMPSFIRNNKYFMYPFYFIAYNGKNLKKAMHFKTWIQQASKEEYQEYYNNLQSISKYRPTDLNDLCLTKILQESKKHNFIADIGCGNGYLLSQIMQNHHCNIIGVDLMPEHKGKFPYRHSYIDNLPFKDQEIDLVLCTHVLEHVLNLSKAISELQRVCKNKLCVVIPKQKYFYFTLDEHINFFPDRESIFDLFGNQPIVVQNLGGDWFIEWKRIS